MEVVFALTESFSSRLASLGLCCSGRVQPLPPSKGSPAESRFSPSGITEELSFISPAELSTLGTSIEGPIDSWEDD